MESATRLPLADLVADRLHRLSATRIVLAIVFHSLLPVYLVWGEADAPLYIGLYRA